MDKPKRVKRAARYLDAVEELMRHYRRKSESYFCPLCRVQYSNCDECLWRAYEGMLCTDAAKKFGSGVKDILDLRRDRGEKWCAASLKRLRRWRRLLKAQLAADAARKRKERLAAARGRR